MNKDESETGIKLSLDDKKIYINGEDINNVAVSEVLSAWKSLSDTKMVRSKVFVIGAFLLEELASRIAEKNLDIKSLNCSGIKLKDRIKDQQNGIDVLRDHCQKSSIEQYAQNTKIESLEKDKKYLHDLIDYQKEDIG